MRTIARCAVALVAGVGVVSYGCSDYVSDPGRGTVTDAKQIAVAAQPDHQAAVASAKARVDARAVAALEKSAWVGQLHNEMMEDLVRNPAVWIPKGKPRNAAERCDMATRLVNKYIGKVFRQAGLPPDPEAMRRMVSVGVRSVPGCETPTMSIFRVAGGTLTMNAVDDTAIVTGAFQGPMYQMEEVQYTDGTPGPVASTVYAIVNQNAHVPAADLQVIASGASTGVSSSEQWTPIYSGGGGGAGDQPEPMSLFAMRRWGPLARIVAVDLIGCAAAAAGAYLDGERRAGRLAAYCVVGGAAASGMKHAEAI